MIVLDTHAALWAAIDPSRLGAAARASIEDALARTEAVVSAISFWVIAPLTAKGRVWAQLSAAEIRSRILGSGITELPLTGDIALLSIALAGLHGDPADRFIAATALAHDATLLTADNSLLSWES